jgi:hypothetical protein
MTEFRGKVEIIPSPPIVKPEDVGGDPSYVHIGSDIMPGDMTVYRDPDPTIVLQPRESESHATVYVAVRSGIGGIRNRDSIFLNGTSRSINIKGTDGKESIRLDGRAHSIYIGAHESEGKGKPGKIYLRDSEGHDSLILDGSAGDIILSNEDCAEEFDMLEEEQIEPGSVMVIESEGKLKQSSLPYDKRVAGVISGAGNYRPGIVLGKERSKGSRKPVALLGKVFCRVDAQYSSIQVGDLLTTSATLGHAMKAQDPARAFGSVLGKALRPLKTGKSLIPILIALQ